MWGMGTDQVISGKWEGLEKIACDGETTHDTQQTDKFVEYQTELSLWADSIRYIHSKW